MASRMIHYAIAKELLKEHNIKDSNSFCLGSIAPDMWSFDSKNKDKNSSHYSISLEKENVRGYDCSYFYNKYVKDREDDFALGYLIHLICDTIYLKDIQANYIYSLGKVNREVVIQLGYQDMHVFNTILIDKYQLEYDILPINSFSVDRICIESLEPFLKEFKKDFIPCNINCQFKVHNVNALFEYIEKCLSFCTRQIDRIKISEQIEDLIPYMINNDIK